MDQVRPAADEAVVDPCLHGWRFPAGNPVTAYVVLPSETPVTVARFRNMSRREPRERDGARRRADPAAPAGGAITVAWSQTGGPAAVTFSAPQQLSTTVTFPTPGVYMLQIAATDSLGARTMQVGPVTVNSPEHLTVASSWILSPTDHSQVTGQVPRKSTIATACC